jgi:hypothetical protein
LAVLMVKLIQCVEQIEPLLWSRCWGASGPSFSLRSK